MINNSVFKRFRIWILALFIAASGAAFVAFDDGDDFELAKNLDIYHSLFRELRIFYVDEIDAGNLIKISIQEMLQSLDPYTVYYPESDIEDYRFITTGEYGGIGAIIQNIDGKMTIMEIYPNYPADKEGLKPGDCILEIQGQSLENKTVDDLGKIMKGQPKTSVRMLISREGEKEPFEKMVMRENVTLKNVPYYSVIGNDIGYIRLVGFTETASKEVKDAFDDLKTNYNVKKLILDLRDNPGGLLMEAVRIVNLFVDKGQEIVSTKGKVSQWNKTFFATNLPIDTEMPIVVLVSRGSASASEIVSGAFQDLDRGVIVGQRTFGKGLVQTTRDLSYNAKLKLTTAKYYIPSGRCIQALDYSHRNPDGSVGTIPDSLISKFKTINGRIVYDGGGIVPDISVEPEILSKISVSLITKNLIFKYATKFWLKHDSISKPEEFKLKDSDFDGFVQFLSDKDFDYETETQKELKQLLEVAKREKYDEVAKTELESLKNKFSHDKSKDLHLFRTEIMHLLESEIVSRYYYAQGRIRYDLAHDIEMKEAISVLNNLPKYNSILNPIK